MRDSDSQKKAGGFLEIFRIIAIILLSLAVGFLVGWRVTILRGNVTLDKTNPNIAYYECFGFIDQYRLE